MATQLIVELHQTISSVAGDEPVGLDPNAMSSIYETGVVRRIGYDGNYNGTGDLQG